MYYGTMYEVHVCPMYNFRIPRPIFTNFATNPTLCQLILTMYLISGWHLSKVQLPYSPTDFLQVRNQPYPLQTDFENVPYSGSVHVQSTTFLFPDPFSSNSQPTLPFTNRFCKCTWFQDQTCPAKRWRNRLVFYIDIIILLKTRINRVREYIKWHVCRKKKRKAET